MRVPDDASALEADRAAWVAEERALRRRRRLRRLIWTRRWERFGLSGPLVVIALLLTGAVGALAVVFVPRPATPPPKAAPAARVPRIAVPAAGVTPTTPVPTLEPATGSALLGRRLPQAPLSGDIGPLDADRLRPAVVVLLDPGCGCGGLVDEVYRQAREFRLDVWLVAPGGPTDGATRRTLARLDADEAAGGARWALDPQAVLARAVLARGTTLVLVRDDGVVTDVLRDVGPGAAGLPAMEIALAGLVPRR